MGLKARHPPNGRFLAGKGDLKQPVVRMVSSLYCARTFGMTLPAWSVLALPLQEPASISFCIFALTQGAACSSVKFLSSTHTGPGEPALKAPIGKSSHF